MKNLFMSLFFLLLTIGCDNLPSFKNDDQKTETPKTSDNNAIVKSKTATLSTYLTSLNMSNGRKSMASLCSLPENSIEVYPMESTSTIDDAAGINEKMMEPDSSGSSGVEAPSGSEPISSEVPSVGAKPVLPDNGAPARCMENTVAYEDKNGTVSRCTPPSEPDFKEYREPQYCGDIPSIQLALCENKDSWDVKNFSGSKPPKSEGLCIYIGCYFYDNDLVVYSQADTAGAVKSDKVLAAGGPALKLSGDSASNSTSSSEGITVKHEKQHGIFQCVQINPDENVRKVPPPPPVTAGGDDSGSGKTEPSPPATRPPEPGPVPVEKCPAPMMPDYCGNTSASFNCTVTAKLKNGEQTFSERGESSCGTPADIRAKLYFSVCKREDFLGHGSELKIECQPIK